MDRDPLTHEIIGAAMDVHSTLGHGFLEAVYQEALLLELRRRDIPACAEVTLPIRYKDEILKTGYRADIICFERILVELKALARVGPNEEAQTINYLKAAGLETGLLLNFGAPRLEYRRFVRSSGPSASSATSADDKEAVDIS